MRTLLFAILLPVMILSMSACGDSGTNGTNGTDGADGAPGADGATGADGMDGADALPPTPILEGHNGDHGMILPYDVQAAYNGDTFFWRVTYRGNEGKRHQYLRYTNGAWQKEGGDRRDAQASIDGDVDQGDLGILSTIYEQRTSIMVNDPNATTGQGNVGNFGEQGCFVTCHNDSRHMPEWTSANGHDGKWVDPAHMTGTPTSGDVALDLWHWRGARSNPIARSDDQNILTLDWTGSTSDGDDGGRKGDSGQSVFFNQNITDGNPDFLLDPATTWGDHTFPWGEFWLTPFYYMTTPEAATFGPNAPNPGALAWADVTDYTAVEGDTVPRRILRPGEGSRADITAYGTTFTPDALDSSLGVWKVQLQRAIDTGNGDDVALIDGFTYEVGFEVHLWEYTTRDHYVSFPLTMSVGSATGDIEAVSILGSGPFDLPNWDDFDTFPSTRVYLFQPGINTYEFLDGTNEADAKVYTNPVTGAAVDQNHGGATSVASGAACTQCHVVRIADGPLSMEELAGQRGGVWTDTPVD